MAEDELSAAFLGRGWSFPPRFARGGADVLTVGGVADIHESLRILFATPPGERAMRPDYGAAMDDLLFEEIDQSLLNRIRTTIETAVLRHEPRIRLDDLEVTPDVAALGRLRISLYYTVRETNSRYNFVFPFYVQEATEAV